jgi:hypothetical protein
MALGVILLAFSGCSESPTQSPQVDAVVMMAAGGGPSVEGADPSEAPLEIELDVRVLGRGFDDGSVAEWLFPGEPDPGVTTLSTQFVSKSELKARLRIDADAIEGLYDIAVTTLRGKKGVGSELFSVDKDAVAQPNGDVLVRLHEFDGAISANNNNADLVNDVDNVNAILGAGGRRLWLETYDGPKSQSPTRRLCIDLSAPPAAVPSQPDLDDFTAAAGGGLADVCSDVLLRTSFVDVDMVAMGTGDIVASGGDLQLLDLNSGKLSEWWLHFDTKHAFPTDPDRINKGLCIARTGNDSWSVSNDCSAESGTVTVPNTIELWRHVRRAKGGGVDRIHVADLSVPFSFNVSTVP